MHWGDYGFDIGIGFGFGWLLMILFWILVILGIVYFIRLIAGSAKKGEEEETAIDILNKRFARGEISRDEREKIKADIMKDDEI